MIYHISYKTWIDSKPLHIGFDEIDGFIRVYDGTRHLTLLGTEEYEAAYNRIRFLRSQKKWYQIYIYIYIFHYFTKIKVDSDMMLSWCCDVH